MNIGTEVNSIEQLATLKKSKLKHSQKVAKKVSYVQAESCMGKYFILPIKLECATNKREHWSKVTDRKKMQRQLAMFSTYDICARIHLDKNSSLIVAITRIGIRKMDSDNLATSAKYVRDGIADALGIDDGDSRIEWVYKQEIGRAYGCKVEIACAKQQPDR